MEQPGNEVLPIKQGILLDLLDQQHPALSSNNDMPVIETKPDAQPEKVEAEAAPEEAELTEESATPATEEQPGADQGKKTPKGVQKRLDELTKQREDAERRAEAEKAEKLRILAMLESQSKVEKPQEVIQEAEPVRPNKADFADEATYLEAFVEYAEKRAEFVAERKFKQQSEEAARVAAEQAMAEAQQKATQAYQERVEKTKAQYADFNEVANRQDVNITVPIAYALLHHEQGPALQYYLGKNPTEATRIAKLDAPSQLVELGIIAASKLTEQPKPEVSAAPPPLKRTKPAETLIVKNPSDMTMDEYSAWRKAGGRN